MSLSMMRAKMNDTRVGPEKSSPSRASFAHRKQYLPALCTPPMDAYGDHVHSPLLVRLQKAKTQLGILARLGRPKHSKLRQPRLGRCTRARNPRKRSRLS